MKKEFALAAFVIAAVPAMAQVKYTVSGTFAGNGKTVYLNDLASYEYKNKEPDKYFRVKR